jgi:hypothetical protein
MSYNRRNFLYVLGGLVAAAAAPAVYGAGDTRYPDRTMRLVMSFSSGSSTDIAACT